ncbi:MAG: sodium:solute symporter family protein [Lentisphaerae bacterium]|nr:sodium:solute symporter family protein [Lentisphaerota bacterium]
MSIWMITFVIVYFFAVGYLGYRGYRATQTAADYLIAGRKTHPYIMAMSYGSTFISTSAIVGFGGAAGVFGMGLLWLTVLNIFVGIFVAFVVFGGRTRALGLRLDAHTFPELIGRRFQSRFLQGAAATLIFVFMPLYASAVLIGAAKYLTQQLGVPYDVALFVFTAIIAVYVIMGGIKGVMYTDALQGTIMLFGMIALIVLTYSKLGGVTAAHQALTDLASQVPEKLAKGGHAGWTAMPKLGSPLWWTLVSTIVMGVGIGVLAQPQLAVRYMTVKSQKELNRGVPVGGVFILMMTGVAFVVGALTNVHFHRTAGQVSIAAAKGDVEAIIPMYLQQAMPSWFSVLFMLTLLSAAMSTLSSQFHVMGTSLGRDLAEQSPRLRNSKGGGMLVTRIGVLVGILVSAYLSYGLEKAFGKTGTEIVARGTAIFFGLCACAFLPMYAGALWSRAITKAGAIAGFLAGAGSSLFWLVFVHEKESTALLLCNKLFGVRSLGIAMVEGKEVFLRAGKIIWAFVDPLFVGLPLAIAVTIAVSLFTRKFSEEHLKRCRLGRTA